MLRGLYTAASGMISQQRKHDIVTNNIANANTPGFKQGTAVSRSFPEVLAMRMNNKPGEPSRVPLGILNTGVLAEENVSLFVQGDMRETKNPFDFALISDIEVPGATFDASGKYVDENGERITQPQAFFTVLNADGEQRYSLNGQFTADQNGTLVTSEGNPVLGRDGEPIVLYELDTGAPIADFYLSGRGQFIGTNGEALLDAAGEPLTLLLTRVDNPHQLIREGNGLYRLSDEQDGGARPVEAEDQVEVRQGYIEASNVDASMAMVDMMASLRAFEANQKVIQYYDQSMDKAVNEIGRV